MKQYVSIKKQQKKVQRAFTAKQRGSWGGLNPVTRKPENPKAYNRKKAGQWRTDSSHGLPFIYVRAA